MKTTLSMTIFGLCLAVALCGGCSSMTDPTNAQARADKMKKAVDAQKHNGMMTVPKNSAPTPTQ
jgi:hypothetical protein